MLLRDLLRLPEAVVGRIPACPCLGARMRPMGLGPVEAAVGCGLDRHMPRCRSLRIHAPS